MSQILRVIANIREELPTSTQDSLAGWGRDAITCDGEAVTDTELLWECMQGGLAETLAVGITVNHR